MVHKNRIFDYSQEIMKEAVRSFADAHKTANVFKKEVLASSTEVKIGDSSTNVPNSLEIVKRIEDFATIIKNGGFDYETQTFKSLDDISRDMEDFIAGEESPLVRDFSVNTLGFVVGQTITRLVSMIDQPELEAWMMVSKELVLKEGTVLYNVVVGKDGHATSRITENGDYNTFNLESTEDYIKTSGGKVGIAAIYSEEAALRAGAVAIQMLTEAAIADMRRFKSIEAIHLLEANAKTYFDALDVTKMPSGRSYKNPTTENGTLLMRDMENFFAKTQAEGFDVDTIFINPLAWAIFLYEPSVKAYFEKTANVHYLVPKKRETIGHNLMTKMTKMTSNNSKSAEGHEVIAPNLIANKKLNIIVTPIVKFHAAGSTVFNPETRYTKNPTVQYTDITGNRADVLLVDSSRALSYIHDGRGIMADKIDNRLRDVTTLKFKAYYNFLLDKDHGVFAFRNINITDDIFDPIQKLTATIAHSEIWPAV
ncbi:MAG: hypothetical protein ACRC5T_03890 [Cetobacterium sp.]